MITSLKYNLHPETPREQRFAPDQFAATFARLAKERAEFSKADVGVTFNAENGTGIVSFESDTPDLDEAAKEDYRIKLAAVCQAAVDECVRNRDRN